MSRYIGLSRAKEAVECLKAELVTGTADLFRGMLRRNEDLVLDSLAQMVFSCYLLARRMGFNFKDLDTQLEDRVRSHLQVGHELEHWYGDLSAYLRHLEHHRKEPSHAQPPGATGTIL